MHARTDDGESHGGEVEDARRRRGEVDVIPADGPQAHAVHGKGRPEPGNARVTDAHRVHDTIAIDHGFEPIQPPLVAEDAGCRRIRRPDSI